MEAHISLAVELIALALYAPFVVTVHEAGHAGFARIGGYRTSSFQLGMGRPFWRSELRGGAVLCVGPWLWLGGACTAVPTAAPSRRRIWFHAGGLIAQAVLAIVLWCLPDSWLVARIAQFNAWVALANLLPWQLADSASDGWLILDLLRPAPRGGQPTMRRRELRQMARREQRVGSRLGALYAELCLAWADLQLGRPDLADDFFGTDPVEVVYEPFLDALYHSVYADWHRLSQRPLAALGAIREVRGARISELSEDADMLLSLAEARTLIALEEHVAAEQVLARTVGSRGALAHQGRILALAARLQSPGDELEYAAWRVLRQLPCAWLDPVEASTVLKQAADALLECGRITAAQGTLGASRAIASALLRDALEEDVAMLRHALGVQATPPKPLPRAQP